MCERGAVRLYMSGVVVKAQQTHRGSAASLCEERESLTFGKNKEVPFKVKDFKVP